MSDPFSTKNLLERCGIPKRFQEAEFSQFTKSLGEVGCSGESLFVSGPRGTGKTHFLCACLKHVIQKEAREKGLEMFANPKKHPVAFLPVPEFMLELRQSYNGTSKLTEADVLDKYTRVELLVLDDLGAERVSDWSIQMLYLLLDRRNRDLKQTMISSNLSLRDIADKLDARVASRITEECKSIKFAGQDRRTAKNRAAKPQPSRPATNKTESENAVPGY